MIQCNASISCFESEMSDAVRHDCGKKAGVGLSGRENNVRDMEA